MNSQVASFSFDANLVPNALESEIEHLNQQTANSRHDADRVSRALFAARRQQLEAVWFKVYSQIQNLPQCNEVKIPFQDIASLDDYGREELRQRYANFCPNGPAVVELMQNDSDGQVCWVLRSEILPHFQIEPMPPTMVNVASPHPTSVTSPQLVSSPETVTSVSSPVAQPTASMSKVKSKVKSKVSKSRSRKDQPPRPRNAFILFRQSKHGRGAQANPHLKNVELSKLIGAEWAAASPEIKEHWKRQAQLESAEHKRKYPDYVYNPRKADEKKRRIRKASIKSNVETPAPQNSDLTDLQANLDAEFTRMIGGDKDAAFPVTSDNPQFDFGVVASDNQAAFPTYDAEFSENFLISDMDATTAFHDFNAASSFQNSQTNLGFENFVNDFY